MYRPWRSKRSAVAGGAGFFLDDGGQNQGLILALHRQAGRTGEPCFLQAFLHGLVGALEYPQIAATRSEVVGIRKEQTLGMIFRRTDML